MGYDKAQLEQMNSGKGFIAALDQSGGSTPKALSLYGVEPSDYNGDAEMFQAVHDMRTRIILADDFTSLLTDHSVEMSTLWSEARGLDLGRGEMRNFFEQTREEQNEDIENLLNADQYAAYQELPQGGGWGGNFGRRGGGNNSGGTNNGGGNNSGGSGDSDDSGNHGGGGPGGY